MFSPENSPSFFSCLGFARSEEDRRQPFHTSLLILLEPESPAMCQAAPELPSYKTLSWTSNLYRLGTTESDDRPEDCTAQVVLRPSRNVSKAPRLSRDGLRKVSRQKLVRGERCRMNDDSNKPDVNLLFSNNLRTASSAPRMDPSVWSGTLIFQTRDSGLSHESVNVPPMSIPTLIVSVATISFPCLLTNLARFLLVQDSTGHVRLSPTNIVPVIRTCRLPSVLDYHRFIVLLTSRYHLDHPSLQQYGPNVRTEARLPALLRNSKSTSPWE